MPDLLPRPSQLTHAQLLSLHALSHILGTCDFISVVVLLLHFTPTTSCNPTPVLVALSKLLTREGGAGADGAILPYVGRLPLISTLKIGADCCQLCKYKLTKPNLTYPNPEE